MTTPLSRFALAAAAIVLFAAGAGGTARSDQLSVTRATLRNGMRVIAVRDPLAPVAMAMLNYRAGANEEDFAGQAHALEHMMFREARRSRSRSWPTSPS